MACGNNHVSRGYLSSQPTPILAQTSSIFSGPFERAPRSERWGGRDHQMYYSEAKGSELHADKIDYFLDSTGRQTIDPNRHLHVIHDEVKQDVIVVVTDRTQGAKNPHVAEELLHGNPSPEEVNNAVQAMLTVLNSLPPGPERVKWP